MYIHAHTKQSHKAYSSYYTVISAQCTNNGIPNTNQGIKTILLASCRRTDLVSLIEVHHNHLTLLNKTTAFRQLLGAHKHACVHTH